MGRIRLKPLKMVDIPGLFPFIPVIPSFDRKVRFRRVYAQGGRGEEERE